MKKIIPLFFIAFLLISPFILETDSLTLRGLKDELLEMETNREKYEEEQEAAKEQVKKYNSQIGEAYTNIDAFGQEIAESKEKIAQLEIEIEDKKVEIETLLSFFQVSNGTNVYLDYAFGANDFTDFIYRTAIVEQLSNHNDNMINEMNDLIEENEKLQKELAEKIKGEENAITSLENLLADANLEISSIESVFIDIDAEIEAKKLEVEYYEDMGCELDEDLTDCLEVIYASGIFKPTKSGVITSEYGYRIDPVSGAYTQLHAGIDIGVSEGTPVYAAASGIVSKLTYKSSCGGNKVEIQHNYEGEKITTRYLHLLYYTVELGDVVTPGDIIAYSGGGKSTSASYGGYDYCTTGAHLHFETRKGWSNTVAVNPRNYIYFPYSW